MPHEIKSFFTFQSVFIFLAILLGSSALKAQILPDSIELLSYDGIKTYEIGKIDVIGASYTDPVAIIGVSGLKVGKSIEVPGRAIPDALKNLLRLKVFTNVEIYASQILEDVMFLEIHVQEEPRYVTHSYLNLRKSFHDDVNKIIESYLRKNTILTEDVKEILKLRIYEFFREKGFLDTEVHIVEEPLGKNANAAKLVFDIDLHKRVKIKEINMIREDRAPIASNQKVPTDRKLRNQLKNTREKKKLFASSKYVESEFETDKKALIAYYNRLGYRDSRIKDTKVSRNEDGELIIDITISEGNKYYFRHIDWVGNTLYTDHTLNKVLGIQKGDVYNPELLDTRLKFSQDGRDVSSLYMDDGYLFFQVNPIEMVSVADSIDIEMQLFEGPQATIDRVEINGNDRTHEHVIRRALRTVPGEKFSRSNILRSQREIMALGYFDPEQLGIQTPVNAQQGTVDILYDLVERPSDQLELSAGYNGTAGVLGTIGVTFNNFSVRNMFKKGAWKPVPTGDGQKLSLRAQSSGPIYQSINFSFTDPWLGGKRPNSFSVGGFLTSYGTGTSTNKRAPSYSRLISSSFYVGLGARLKRPDDYFFVNTTLNIQNFSLKQNAYLEGTTSSFFQYNGQNIYRGTFNNIYLQNTISRSSVNEPLFPTSGSNMSVTLQLTPPYSLFRDKDDYNLTAEEAEQAIADENERRNRYVGSNDPLGEFGAGVVINNETASKKFKFLEYYKVRADFEWYASLVGKLVLRTSAKFGFLGYYNKSVGIPPFERFQLGGDGLSNQNNGIAGIDILRLRGYDVEDVQDHNGDGYADSDENAIVFNKYTMELRYPVSTNPSSTIFVMGFLEAGNAFNNFTEYRPFDLKRSAGFGLRVYLPVFGLLGFDYGFGFDKPALIESNDTKFTDYAKFGLIIGFEPD